jgi:hypothetical protein
MKFVKSVGILLATACIQVISAQGMPDTLWLCKDSIPDDEMFYFRLFTCDTPVVNVGCFTMADTGKKLDGSYINFNYQFTGAKPGYAGFKIFWDNGLVKYDATTYDSMFLWYKGPLPGHKVHMVWGQSPECGGTITYQDFGEFESSATWKKTTIPFPTKRGPTSLYPDSAFVKNGLFELRMLIYNQDGSLTPSGPGNLMIDNIGFIKKQIAVSNPLSAAPAKVGSRFFVPKISGKVNLAVYSLQGERLFNGFVDVVAGKRYEVSRFTGSNSNLPAQWIHCVRIIGSGVNFAGKVCR